MRLSHKPDIHGDMPEDPANEYLGSQALRDYIAFLTRELLHYRDEPDEASEAFTQVKLQQAQREVDRREALYRRHGGNPLARETNLRVGIEDRIAAVKAAWPILRFCEEQMGCTFRRTSSTRLVACCQLPGHIDATPSFVIYEDQQSCWCYGCNRGGDVIDLAEVFFDVDQFIDALRTLETFAGITPPRPPQRSRAPRGDRASGGGLRTREVHGA